MTRARRCSRIRPVVVVALLAAALAAVAGSPLPEVSTWESGSTTDQGVVHTGVGSRSEAREFPCPPGDTGPVVCVPDRGTDWRLTSTASGECSRTVVGWHGDCVRAFDAGDHVRVWGTRGIPPREFTITWLAPSPDGKDRNGSAGGTSGPAEDDGRTEDGPSSPSSVPAPVVAYPWTPSAPPPTAAAPSEHPEPVDGESSDPSQSRRGEVPENVYWDPPLHDVPGYSDVVALPGPTYPGLSSAGAREDAGAPAAAGVFALVASGWVWWERHRRRDEPATR